MVSPAAFAEPESSSGDTPVVPLTKVVKQEVVRNRTFEAEFRPYQTIDLHANVAGFVKSINVDIGDVVKKGDVLAELEVPELKEDIQHAKAVLARNEKQVGEAKANAEDAHLEFDRLSQISKSKPRLVAQQELDTASAKDRATSAALAAAQQEVLVSKAEVAKLNAIENYCKIVAPFSGVVIKRYADEGALVQGGVNPSGAALPLIRLAQNDRLRVDFPVTVANVHQVKIGEPIDIKVTATGQLIHGKVSRFSRNVDMATRTMDVEADVTNSDLSLIPGTYADATLVLERHADALTIPAQSITDLKNPTVLVLGANNVLEERPVVLGLSTPDLYEVVSGVKETDMVVVGSRSQFKAGQKVEPKVLEVAGAK